MQLRLVRKRINLFIGVVLILLVLSACQPVKVTVQQTSPPSAQEQQQTGSQEAQSLIQVEKLVVGLLLAAAFISILSDRLRIPYTVGLVIAGVGITFISSIPFRGVTPEIILILLLPPLLFDAALRINFQELRKELRLILLLAILGVFLTTVLVGITISVGAGIPITIGLVFGALIAPTDPVSVIALLRTLGVPKRLQLLIEGESLLNDGTAIVLFLTFAGIAQTQQVNPIQSLASFVVVSGGGILVGIAVGLLGSQVISRIQNHLVETSLTTVIAYGAYLIAQPIFQVSGVLAVVIAGMIVGNLGQQKMSPTTRIVVFNFWEFAAFLANTFVFLLIGLAIEIQLLLKNSAAILWAIAAVLIARMVTTYGLSRFGDNIPKSWKHILFWGSPRGAVSLALALSLVPQMPYRDQLLAMAFGVVLFSILIQGTTMNFFVHKLGLSQQNPVLKAYERQHAKALITQAGLDHLHNLLRSGMISSFTWHVLSPLIEARRKELSQGVKDIMEENPELRAEEFRDAWREYLRAQRSALTSLLQADVVSEETYSDLVAGIDSALQDPSGTWPPLEEKQDQAESDNTSGPEQ